jgi:hypothetical protein
VFSRAGENAGLAAYAFRGPLQLPPLEHAVRPLYEPTVVEALVPPTVVETLVPPSVYIPPTPPVSTLILSLYI